MRSISLFKNFTKGMGSRTLAQIVKGIRGDHYKETILEIRDLVGMGDKEKADQLKKGLVAFTVSGLFEGGRRLSFLKTYNPFVILDIDKLDPDVLPDLVLKIQQIEFTKVAFISPSGRGLKIIVEVDSEMKNHKAAYRQVMKFYQKNLIIEIDKSGSDISRLCFMSHDPEVYFNEKSTVFKVVKSNRDITQSSTPSPDFNPRRAPDLSEEPGTLNMNYPQAFAVCVTQTNAKMVFEVGNRNNYIYQLSAFCCRAGIPLEVAIEESKKGFDFDCQEMERTIRSAYDWQSPSLRSGFSSAPEKPLKGPNDPPSMIPLKVFDNLPEILKRACEAFEHKHKRDFFITGALGVLSGMLPRVTGFCRGRDHFPNLYAFVIAPPEIGKEVLNFARSLGSAYHLDLKEKSRRKLNDYKNELLAYQREVSKYIGGTLEKLPKEPSQKRHQHLFIPGNSSVERLHQYLDDNEEGTVIFEPDASALNEVLNQDRGDYCYLLRKAYDQGDVLISRKNGTGYMELEWPRLSVVLGGTLSQAKQIIPTSKDQLFSQFLFYTFPEDDIQLDRSPRAKAINFEKQFKDLSIEILELVDFLKDHPTEIKLKDKQKEKFEEAWRGMFKEMRRNYEDQLSNTFREMKLICFKIAMILSAFRKFEERSTKIVLFCTDQDFKTAIQLTETYWEHSIFHYEQLSKQDGNFFETRKKEAG